MRKTKIQKRNFLGLTIKDSGTIVCIILLSFILGAGLLAMGALYQFKNISQYSKHPGRANGHIVGYISGSTYDYHQLSTSVEYYPNVSFIARDGKKYGFVNYFLDPYSCFYPQDERIGTVV